MSFPVGVLEQALFRAPTSSGGLQVESDPRLRSFPRTFRSLSLTREQMKLDVEKPRRSHGWFSAVKCWGNWEFTVKIT